MDSATVFGFLFSVLPELSYTNVASYLRRLNFDYKLEFVSEPDSGTVVSISNTNGPGKMYFPFKITNVYTGKEVGLLCNDYGSEDASPIDYGNGAADYVWTPGEDIFMIKDSLRIAGAWLEAYNYNMDLFLPIPNSEKNRKAYDDVKGYNQGDTVFYQGTLWHAKVPTDPGTKPQSVFSDQDDDGIFGLGLPTIENGGVNSRGQIISDNYDPTSAPRSYLNNSNITVYYFQEFATAPTISLQPESTIACQVGNSVQFSVDVTSNNSPIYFSWYVSTADQPNSWTEIIDNITYSGSKTNTLTIDDVQLNMDGNKYRVQINTDNYACIQETDDNVTLDVEEALPVVNTVDNLILCDDNSFGTDTDGINSGINLRSNVASILGNNQNEDDYTVSFHLSEVSASDISDLGISNSDNYTNTNRQEPIYVRVQNNTTQCYDYLKSFDLIIAFTKEVFLSIIFFLSTKELLSKKN